MSDGYKDCTDRGFAAICLYNPKNSLNVGGVLRAARCYGAELVVVAGRLRIKGIQHASTDTGKAWRHIPTIRSVDPFDTVPLSAIPIAVEICDRAISLPTFVHPERAYYVFGPEDGSLGESIIARCKYVISVPTAQCMNLAATVNVILYDRLAKQIHLKDCDKKA